MTVKEAWTHLAAPVGMTSRIPMRRRMVVSETMPRRKILRRPVELMTNQEQMLPRTPQAVTPTPRLNAFEVFSPASSKK